MTPYADIDVQRAFQAMWFALQYNAPGLAGERFRRKESKRKARQWREVVSDEEKARRRIKAREGHHYHRGEERRTPR